MNTGGATPTSGVLASSLTVMATKANERLAARINASATSGRVYGAPGEGGALAERGRGRSAAVVATCTRPEVTGRYRRLLEGLAGENPLGRVAEGSR